MNHTFSRESLRQPSLYQSKKCCQNRKKVNSIPLAGIEPQTLHIKNQVLKEYKGAMTEQFVFLELWQKYEPFYWSSERVLPSILRVECVDGSDVF